MRLLLNSVLTPSKSLLTNSFICRGRSRFWRRYFDRGVLAHGIVVLSCVVFFLPGCDFKVVRDPNIVVRTLGSDPPGLNPITSNASGTAVVNRMVVEQLARRSAATNEWIPVLAESWEPALDHLSYTFILRDGVRWHDGAPFTANDVVYSFERINDPKVGAGHLQQQFGDAGITKIERVGERGVRFLLERPYVFAFDALAEMPILPKHLFDNGEDLRTNPHTRHPIGTGPMRFVEWKTGRIIRLERNDQYWGEPTQYQGMVFKIIPDQHVSFQALKKGQIDVAGLSGLAWAKQTDSKKFNKRFQKLRFLSDSSGFFYIGWNAKHPILKDKRVRRALTMLTPREQFRDSVFFGAAKIATGPFAPGSPQRDRSITPIAFDPIRAARLLDQAGVRDHDGDGIRDRDGTPFAITLLLPGASRVYTAMSNILRENFAAVGIDLNIRTLEWSVFLKTTSEGDFDAYIAGWSGATEADPYQIWHSSQRATGSNRVDFNHAEADDLLDAARVEFDPVHRNAMYHRLHQILHDEQPYTFLFNFYASAAVHRRFTNVVVHPGGLDYREWGVGPSEELVQ